MKLISLLKSATFAAAMVVGIAAAQAQAPTSTIESRLSTALKDLGFADGKLPVLKPAFGNYVDAVQVGNTLYLSSAAPQKPDGQFAKGRVPSEVSVEDAQKAAKLACVRQIARLQLVLGDLNKVKRIVFVKGKVLATPEFTDHTTIVDACSELFVTVFGEAGKHTRTTDGLASSPFGVTVEVETIVEVK